MDWEVRGDCGEITSTPKPRAESAENDLSAKLFSFVSAASGVESTMRSNAATPPRATSRFACRIRKVDPQQRLHHDDDTTAAIAPGTTTDRQRRDQRKVSRPSTGLAALP